MPEVDASCVVRFPTVFKAAFLLLLIVAIPGIVIAIGSS